MNTTNGKVKITARVVISIVCFILTILSGFALLVSSQFDSSSPVNYSLSFKSVENGDFYDLTMTGSVTNIRNVEYPYIDFKISYNVGGETKTHIFRVENLKPHERLEVSMVIETDYTVKPVYSRMEKITTTVKSAAWLAKTISLAVLCTSLFVLIVPNAAIGILAFRRSQQRELLKREKLQRLTEQDFACRRRELYLVTSKTGNQDYDFGGALIEAEEREPVPNEALSIVKGVYRLKTYDGIKPDRFTLEIDRDVAQEPARCFNELETGLDVVVTHMPAQNLFGNAVAELITRTGRRLMLGFLRLRDAGTLFYRYGGHFSFYGTVSKLNTDAGNLKNKTTLGGLASDTETEAAEFIPSVQLLLTVPLITPENQLEFEGDFYDYEEYDDDEYDETTHEDDTDNEDADGEDDIYNDEAYIEYKSKYDSEDET